MRKYWNLLYYDLHNNFKHLKSDVKPSLLLTIKVIKKESFGLKIILFFWNTKFQLHAYAVILIFLIFSKFCLLKILTIYL